MACCGKRKGRVVKTTAGPVQEKQLGKSAPAANLVIAPAKRWLPFPITTAPPGGWSGFGLTAKGPEELAQKLAGLRLHEKKFTTLQAIYKEIVKEYCGRTGALCGKNFKA